MAYLQFEYFDEQCLQIDATQIIKLQEAFHLKTTQRSDIINFIKKLMANKPGSGLNNKILK